MFGFEIVSQLASSKRFNFVPVECESPSDLVSELTKHDPVAVVFNHDPGPMPWAPLAAAICCDVPTIAIVHNVTSEMADNWPESFFDVLVAHDPDLKTKNPLFMSAPRPIGDYAPVSHPPQNGPIRVGSFGFADPTKHFDEVVSVAQQSFDHCVIRLHFPRGDFADPDGKVARSIIDQCKSIVKPNASLEISSEFLTRNQLIEFLASNHINVLLYEPNRGYGGISSAPDWALASGRPLALRRGKMFRNFDKAAPSIFVDDLSLPEILQNGIAPLASFKRDWSIEKLVAAYEMAVDRALSAKTDQRSRRDVTLRRAISAVELLTRAHSEETAHIRKRQSRHRVRKLRDKMANASLIPAFIHRSMRTRVKIPRFNTVLDDEARRYYQPAIKTLRRVAPAMMERKIERANVQQGFMLAAVEELSRGNRRLPILSAGCFDDTAYAALEGLGYKVEGIDPAVNCDLATFKRTNPGKIGTYGVVFSTSVIEHVPDDEFFVKDMMDMASAEGVVILTCDYRDDWAPGQPKPSSDVRMYTRNDLQRLVSAMGDVTLIDEPDWDNHPADFRYFEFGRELTYGFATLAVNKRH